MSTPQETMKRLSTETTSRGSVYILPHEEAHIADLVARGFVQVHPSLTSDEGHRLAQATDAGHAAVANLPTPAAQTAPAKAGTPSTSGGFAIEKGVPMPERIPFGRAPRAKKPSEYPFEQMDIGDSFLIPATADVPEPAKKHGSAMSQANKALWPKRFTMTKVQGGARCYRVDDDTAATRPEPRKRTAKAPGAAPAIPATPAAWTPPAAPQAAAQAPAWGAPGVAAADKAHVSLEGWPAPEAEVEEVPEAVVWE